MELYLSRSSPVNTILSDVEGRALFRIFTPGFAPGVIRWTRKTTTIFRVSAEAAVAYKEELVRGKDGDECWDLGVKEKARIHWHTFSSTRIIFNGQILEVRDFMPREGVLGLKRTFIGPDGQSYSWKKEMYSCRLVRDEGTNRAKVIARMHQRNLIKGTKACLEIDPAGLHMLDLIVATWVYYEARRRDDEREHM